VSTHPIPQFQSSDVREIFPPRNVRAFFWRSGLASVAVEATMRTSPFPLVDPVNLLTEWHLPYNLFVSPQPETTSFLWTYVNPLLMTMENRFHLCLYDKSSFPSFRRCGLFFEFGFIHPPR